MQQYNMTIIVMTNKLMIIVYTALTMQRHQNSPSNFTFSWKIEIDDMG